VPAHCTVPARHFGQLKSFLLLVYWPTEQTSDLSTPRCQYHQLAVQALQSLVSANHQISPMTVWAFYRASAQCRRAILVKIWCRNSVCSSVRHVAVLHRNGLTYCHSFFTTRKPINHSSFINIKHLCEIQVGIKISQFSTCNSEYLTNDTTYRHSYYRTLIGTRMRSIERCHSNDLEWLLTQISRSRS